MPAARNVPSRMAGVAVAVEDERGVLVGQGDDGPEHRLVAGGEEQLSFRKPNHLARRFSSSTCSVVVAWGRELERPQPYFSTAAFAAAFTFGWLVRPR